MSKRIIGRVAAGVASISLYLPIIAGLISPMVWILAAWYFSWDLLSYIVPFSDRWPGIYCLFNAGLSEELRIGVTIAFRFSQILLFCTGLFLLCYGLIKLAKARAGKEGLVTSGPYRWVRHPQHLGILLMLFLLAFPIWSSYSDFLVSVTRAGDMISLSSVLFLLILVADLEDYRVTAEFGVAYEQYRLKTPFLLPIRIQLPNSFHNKALARGKPLRYLLAILFLWIWLVLLSFYFTFVPLIFTG
ncbi:MAG: hypothetical protein AM326_03245 [Candidatus Thorarchaeota archaeon SMTZ-45]|nr:MAG: hypothetical protein AM326_03245 [Candidatus Thorarchaeota archaeon SMTZ-45]